MINGGDGTPRREDVSSGRVASPDLLDAVGSKSDGNNASPLSRYSSCRVSEFQGDCSTKSDMGTPSLCSSVQHADCLDSENGSFRSLVNENGVDNFSSVGRLERNSERSVRVRFSQGGGNCNELSSNNEIKVSVAHHELDTTPVVRDNLLGTSDETEPGTCKEGTLFEARNASLSELDDGENDIQLSQSNSDDEMILGGKEDEEGEEGELIKCGHSGDEDLMYNYGTDDNSGKNLPHLKNVQHGMGGKDGGNPLLINSSIAFGADDWNDFVQETGEIRQDPLILDTFHEPREVNLETRGHPPDFPSEGWTDFSIALKTEEEKDSKDLPLGKEQVGNLDEGSRTRDACSTNPSGSRESAETAGTEPQDVGSWRRDKDRSSTASTSFQSSCEQYQKDVRDSSQCSNQVRVADGSEEHLNSCSITNIFEMHQEPVVEKVHLEAEDGPRVKQNSKEVDHPCLHPEKLNNIDSSQHVDIKLEDIDMKLEPLPESTVNQHSFRPTSPLTIKTDFSDDEMQNSYEPGAMETDQTRCSMNSGLSADIYEEHTPITKAETVEMSEFLDDVLHDMEEILLNSTESPGARFSHGRRSSHSESIFSTRDGGLTASTSAADDVETFIKQKQRIDGVEVIGAKQKKGDVSLSERLVGVKEYTVYIIRVWSGNDHWKVERRYRDFITLYRRLKSFFAEQGWSLPSEWSSIDRESKKLFGSASPDVVSERSALIQDCLRSVIHCQYFSHPPNALLWFLSPQDSDLVPSSPEHNNRPAQQSIFVSEGAETENISNLGKTIPLIVEIRPYKSMKELLEGQHYCCAGCRKHFDEGRTLVRDFVQTFGWGKPRLCQYMGQLFCSSCHTNETAVLPARVLHHWDFTEYPVCQLAKSYLDSIQDKPMLCLSAVNPSLFTKVPGLLHVMGIRKKIMSMLPFVRCPFRRSINRGLGCRSYLLDSNDFFALRDLIDLSKGAFAALPTMLETVSRKILEHITEQCLICCDVGIPCSAKQACRDTSSLIFPFQEDEVERCTFCKQVFHKQCLRRLGKCPCQAQLGGNDESRDSFKMESSGALDLPGRGSHSVLSAGLLSTLFPKVNSDRTKDHREDNAIILMDSLPSTSF